MIAYRRSQCFNLNSFVSYALIALIVLIMTLSSIKHQIKQSKPCCIKGYICRAVINIAK